MKLSLGWIIVHKTQPLSSTFDTSTISSRSFSTLMYCMKTVVCVSRRHIFALTSATPFISTNYNKNACELSVLHSFHNKRFCNLTCYYLKNSFTRQPHLFLSGTFDLSNLWVNSCTGSVLDYKRYKKADIDGACKPDLTLGNKKLFLLTMQ